MKKRWLPDHVTEYTDRHGKKRYRYRRTGYPVHHFKSVPGTEEFRIEHAEAKARITKVGDGRYIPGSIDELVLRYYESPRWKKMIPASQRTYRGIIERFREGRGTRPVVLVGTKHLDRILGEMSDRPAAANNMRKVMKRLFGYAVKIGMRRDNPATETDGFKTKKGGFHTWTEEEITQYREKHAYGTKARLAMELMLNTAARRCNAVHIRRTDYREGRFYVDHAKNNEDTSVMAFPETVRAIDAMPVAGIEFLLVTEFGKPFTPAGFGNWFRDRCNEAGLPQCSAHGLRKAMSRRLAEGGATDAQGRAVTGQKKNQTFAYYAEKANRAALADTAMANLFGAPENDEGNSDV